MRFNRISAVLAAGLVGACAPAHVVTTPAPAPVAGDRIRLTERPDTTHFVIGRMVSLTADSLVFERFVPGTAGRTGNWVVRTIATDSVARLQARIGRRGNGFRGALIGGAVGLGLGLACTIDSENSSAWVTPTPGECLLGGALTGAGIGLVVGAFRRSDVWAPVGLPARRPEPAAPPVAAGHRGDGARVPIRLSSP